MRGVLVGLVLVTSAFSAALPVLRDGPVASACSCPDCDVVRDAEVIVAGRITRWERATLESPFQAAHYVPISVELKVDRVFKGTAPSTVHMVDLPSLVNLKDPSRTDLLDNFVWAGAAGACGVFDEDPTGDYIVIGFNAENQIPWQAGRLSVLFLGDEPSGEWYDRAMARLAHLGGPYPPAAGNSAAAAEAHTGHASNDWMFLSAIGAALLLITLVLILVGPRNDRKR